MGNPLQLTSKSFIPDKRRSFPAHPTSVANFRPKRKIKECPHTKCFSGIFQSIQSRSIVQPHCCFFYFSCLHAAHKMCRCLSSIQRRQSKNSFFLKKNSFIIDQTKANIFFSRDPSDIRLPSKNSLRFPSGFIFSMSIPVLRCPPNKPMLSVCCLD